MKISRYRVPLILYVFTVVFNIIIFFLWYEFAPTGVNSQDFTRFIPFTGPLELLLIFLLIFPIMALVGGLIGIFVSPVLIFIHKAVFGRSMTYGIEEVQKSDKFKRTFKGIFPGLMAINFSLLIADEGGIQKLLIPDMWSSFGIDALPELITFSTGIIFTLIISYALFSGFWAISDSGIVYSNRKGIEKKGKESPVMVQSIGSWYNYLLKGYAGIGVIFAYYDLALIYLDAIGGTDLKPFIVFFNLYIFLGYFLILPSVTLPSIIILDLFKDRRIKFTRTFAAKLGIIDEVDVELKKVSR